MKSSLPVLPRRALGAAFALACSAALLSAAAPAAAEETAKRYIDEPVWSEFVYEKIGATPSIRLGSQAEPKKVAAVATPAQDAPATKAETRNVSPADRSASIARASDSK